jgi:DNA-binding MarR family transcriptional regulator
MRHSAFSSGNDLPADAAELKDRLYSILRRLGDVTDDIPAEGGELPNADRVLSIIKARRARERIFDADLFADPAWDMLLELYAAEMRGVRMSVSSLCIGAAVPATTALRWIKTLETKGLIRRNADPLDGRRIFISLAPEASAAMGRLLKACPPSEPLL